MIDLGYCLGLRQWQKVGEVTARNPGKGQVLAVGWCLELRYDSRDFVEIRQVERFVGSYRKSDSIRSQWNEADQLEDFGSLGPSAMHAMVDGDLEHIEAFKVRVGPFSDSGTVSDADRWAIRLV